MIIKNSKPILIVGYPDSSMTDEAVYFIEEEGSCVDEILTPDEFLDLKNKNYYQYFIGGMGILHRDLTERSRICSELDNLDCISIIHDTSVIARDFKPQKGLFICPFVTVLQKSFVDRFCWIENYSLIAHYCNIGRNCIINPGVIVGGRTTIGNNCLLRIKSAVSNKITICDNTVVEGFSNVTKNISCPGVYVGSPARKLTRNIP